MTTIRVETDMLEQVCLHLEHSVSVLQSGSAELFRAVYGAPSYDGQYGPWLWGLAEEASASLHILADQLTELAEWLSRVTAAFIEADRLQASGNVAWAALVYDLVERGQPPATVDSLYAWMASDVRPPWIDEATWRAMDPALRSETLESARLAYEEQLARIERLRTPPWEKDESWLWTVAGISPAVLSAGHYFTDEELAQYRQHVENLRAEYEAKWEDFLQSQSIYKFGVGDDLSEAFTIYLFGLDGAAEHGLLIERGSDGELLGGVVDRTQGLLERTEFLGSVGPPDQYIDLGNPTLPFTDAYLSGHVHYNLCGQLATSATMGMDPIDGLASFRELMPDYPNGHYTDGAEILGNPATGTSAQNLSDLMEANGWTAEPIGYAADTEAWAQRPPQLHEIGDKLESGQTVLALVSLDTQSGYLTASDTPRDAAHWVSILQTFETEGGKGIVRVYNPYFNREEWYPWQDLQESWELGSKLDRQGDPLGPNFRGVIGSPSTQQLWSAPP